MAKAPGRDALPLSPLVAAAAMRFDERIALMPALYRRAVDLAAGLAGLAGTARQPGGAAHEPDAPVPRAAPEAVAEARDELARTTGCWLVNGAQAAEVPGWSMTELYVGDSLLGADNDARDSPVLRGSARCWPPAQADDRAFGFPALSRTAFATLLLIACMMGANHVAARMAFDHGVDVATAVAFRSGVTALVVGLLVLVQRVPLQLRRATARAAGDRPARRRAEPVPVFGGGAAAGGAGAAGLQHLSAVDRAVGARALRHRPEPRVLRRCR